MSEQFTLSKYRERVMKPLMIALIRSGRMDAALDDPTSIRDPETMKAVEDRLLELAKRDAG